MNPRATVSLVFLSGLIFSCSGLNKKLGSFQEKEPDWVKTIQQIDKINENQTLKVSQAIEKITFGSCSDQNLPQPIWKPILEENSQLFIGLGDNIYASLPETKPISQAYLKQLNNKDIRSFRQSVPWIGTWDDHDYGFNDGGGLHSDYEEALASFRSYFPNSSKVISPNQKGIYHSFIIGNKPKTIQIIVLDTRSFRSSLEKDTRGIPLIIYRPTLDTKKTILGEEQWIWLENELQRPANLRLLISSIQVLPLEHGFEKWSNFPHERKRLFDLFKKHSIKNLVILSGDRHLSEVSKIQLDKKQKIFEVTSSGLNRVGNLFQETNFLRTEPSIFEQNYGIFDIDYLKKQISYSVKNVEGKTIQQHKIKF